MQTLSTDRQSSSHSLFTEGTSSFHRQSLQACHINPRYTHTGLCRLLQASAQKEESAVYDHEYHRQYRQSARGKHS